MKIRLFYNKDIKDNKLEIHYYKLDNTIKQILKIANSPIPIIVAKKDEAKLKLNIFDICYIQSANKNTFIYLIDEMYTTSLTLQAISEQYEVYGFIRVNKYTIINIYEVKEIKLGKHMKHMISLESGDIIELSRSYRDNFFNYLGQIYDI